MTIATHEPPKSTRVIKGSFNLADKLNYIPARLFKRHGVSLPASSRENMPKDDTSFVFPSYEELMADLAAYADSLNKDDPFHQERMVWAEVGRVDIQVKT